MVKLPFILIFPLIEPEVILFADKLGIRSTANTPEVILSADKLGILSTLNIPEVMFSVSIFPEIIPVTVKSPSIFKLPVKNC
ncbi:MAG: hypothetical protein HC917_10890 [Richelia sp. SM2_1_7]|nr:hypothetical protein [Richelia sp. SM2_1_7]